MNLRRTTRTCLLAAVVALAAALGAASGAAAATGVSVTAYDIGQGQDSFKAFDPSLGTLTSVSVQISGQIVPLILSDATGAEEPLSVTQSFLGFAGKGFTTQTTGVIPGIIIATTPGAPAL